MDNERSQYRTLVRSFSGRFVDNELINADGDTGQTAINILALLTALGICIAFLMMHKYYFVLSRLPYPALDSISWGDKEFLISISMAVTGVLAIVSWDALFPDVRDCLILTALPVRMRTFFTAKLTSVLTVFSLAILAVNLAPAIVFPVQMLKEYDSFWHYLRYVAAHVTASVGGSAFVFLAFLAVQGVLINVLSYRQFKRVSAFIQLAALFGILLLFFLVPNIAHPDRLALPSNRAVIGLVPSFWFLGLYQWMLGYGQPVAGELAARAGQVLAACTLISLVMYTAGYARYVRRTVEESGAVTDHGKARRSWITVILDHTLLREHHERVVFYFVWRTMTRNRSHRLILAAYFAVGLAYVLEGVARLLKVQGARALFQPNADISAIAIVLPFFLLLGMRILFSLPVELKSNWAFRITEDVQPEYYLLGVRKLMLLLGVAPVCVIGLPCYALLWGGERALCHILLSAVALLLVISVLLRNFRKIPFTCSLLPGNANLKAMFAAYGVLFLGLSWTVVHIELALVRDPTAALMTAGAGVAALAFFGYRRRITTPPGGFIYEERPGWRLQTLELSQ